MKKQSNPKPPDIKHKPDPPPGPNPKDVTDFEKAISDDIFKTMVNIGFDGEVAISRNEFALDPDHGFEVITNLVKAYVDQHPEKIAELNALFDKHWAEGTLQELLDSQPESVSNIADQCVVTIKTIRGNMTKNFLKSKTLWFNVLTIGLACFAVVTDNVDIQPAYVGIVNGIGNVFLRFLTKEKLLLR